MAITLADFTKIWASTSPLTPYAFSDANYKQGWNFVGATPPARQMWDFIQKQNDEKLKYIVDNFLPLSGGTMTGAILTDSPIKASTDDNAVGVYGGTDYGGGSVLQVFGKDNASYPGWFSINANDGVNAKILVGKPDGTFTWAGKTIPTKDVNIQTGKTASTSVPANSTVSIPITFSPAFSSVPVVIATVQTGYDKFYATVGSLTTSSASIKVNNASGTERSVTTGWVAISI